MNLASSVAIIGGADGPTSIFLSQFSLLGLLPWALLALLAVGGLVALWYFRH